MALRARLSAPQPAPREEWPHHRLEYTTIPARLLSAGDRRLEAETYLSQGYGVRLAIEARSGGWVPFGEPARVWQPFRLKGILVSPEFGKPFLAATQVFDFRPIPRKWLALERTRAAAGRFVERGTILVTCSGAVGRTTLAFAPHLETLITHDLLRVEARDQKWYGWLYAYLRAPKTRAMMTSAHYGHIIKHLEVSHLNALPIPCLPDDLLETFNEQVREILRLRDEAHAATLAAEAHFEKCIGLLEVVDHGERGFEARSAKALANGGRRFDASFHNPVAASIKKHLEQKKGGIQRLEDCGFNVWVPGRYKRVPADDGVVFLDSSDLFEINPDALKRFSDCRFGDEFRGRVKPNWILMASSGQTYGLVGGAVIANDFYVGKVVANHVIRIAPRSKVTVRPGFLVTALTHPALGRPLVKSFTFGSSVPEISPEDVRAFPIVRLSERDENQIADLAEKAAELRGQADLLETALAAQAEAILDRFIAGGVCDSISNLDEYKS